MPRSGQTGEAADHGLSDVASDFVSNGARSRNQDEDRRELHRGQQLLVDPEGTDDPATHQDEGEEDDYRAVTQRPADDLVQGSGLIPFEGAGGTRLFPHPRLSDSWRFNEVLPAPGAPARSAPPALPDLCRTRGRSVTGARRGGSIVRARHPGSPGLGRRRSPVGP